MLRNSLLGALVGCAVFSFTAQSAWASHIFVSNVRLGGVALDSMAGPTNPLLLVEEGGTLDFTLDIAGSSFSDITVGFDGSGGPSPGAFQFLFVGGTATFTQEITFSTAGHFDLANVFIDVVRSEPDYRRPNGSTEEGVFLPFRLHVGNSVVPGVPIPAALPLFASVLGIGGFFGYRRKRNAAMT